jgi:hypothetical protein
MLRPREIWSWSNIMLVSGSLALVVAIIAGAARDGQRQIAEQIEADTAAVCQRLRPTAEHCIAELKDLLQRYQYVD